MRPPRTEPAVEMAHAEADARAEARASDTLLHDVIGALTEAVALFDDAGRLIMCNDRFRDANASIAEFIAPGVHWETLLRETARRRAVRNTEGREAAWVEDMLARTDAFERFEIARSTGGAQMISIRPTSLGGFIIAETDVTARRDAEASVRDSEQMLSTILDASPANLTLSRIGDGEIIYRSPASADLFGPEATARDQFADPRDRADFLTELLPTGRIDDFPAIACNGDGEPFPALFSARIIDYRGEDAMVSNVTDLTDIRAAEAAAKEASIRLRDAIESLDQGLALFDRDDRLVAWNRRYEELNAHVIDVLRTGASYPEMLEAAIETGRLSPDQIDKVRESGQRASNRRRRSYEFRHADGRWFEVTRNSASNDGFVVTRQDITERKHAEEEMERQKEALHQSEKLSALGELLAGVAHELNNPLSVVVGHALMLEEESDDPALVARTRKISNAADRCSRIVKTFLAMARQRPAKLERTDLAGVIEAALDVAGYGLRSAGASVELNLSQDLPRVQADADQLAQVFANLFVNAEHAIRDLGADGFLRITARAAPDSGAAIVQVEDNGPGIPEPIRRRIFEPFFTTKSVGSGTGIGLAFCHRIIESHGGRISVGESDLGGACFAIMLDAAPEAPPRHAGHLELDGPRGHALVIDDEPDVAELIADALASDGYETTVASSGEAGLALLPGTFDVILSDVNMPGLGGEALLQTVQARWPDLAGRLGFITGDTLSPNAAEMLAATARPYLEKPVSPAEVRKLARRLLDGVTEAPET